MVPPIMASAPPSLGKRKQWPLFKKLYPWWETFLDLCFPEPELPGSPPRLITGPVCRRSGNPYPGALDAPFESGESQERKWHFDWARSQYFAEGQVRFSILGFKYRNEYYHRKRLIHWICQAFDQHASSHSWDAIVPVPLYFWRYWKRGFNQSKELALGLSQRTHLPIIECLQRLVATQTQTRQSRQDRWKNMRRAFALRPSFDVRGQSLLLIDDVFTTGATAEGCARILRQAGAHTIAVLTIAHG